MIPAGTHHFDPFFNFWTFYYAIYEGFCYINGHIFPKNQNVILIFCTLVANYPYFNCRKNEKNRKMVFFAGPFQIFAGPFQNKKYKIFIFLVVQLKRQGNGHQNDTKFAMLSKSGLEQQSLEDTSSGQKNAVTPNFGGCISATKRNQELKFCMGLFLGETWVSAKFQQNRRWWWFWLCWLHIMECPMAEMCPLTNFSHLNK